MFLSEIPVQSRKQNVTSDQELEDLISDACALKDLISDACASGGKSNPTLPLAITFVDSLAI